MRSDFLGECALQVGLDHVVFSRYDVPGRFAFPGCDAGFVVKRRGANRSLCSRHDCGLLCRQVLGKTCRHALRGHVEKAVFVGGNVFHAGRRRVVLAQVFAGLTGIRRERGDIHQAADLLVGAGLTDYRTAPGVPDQDHVVALVVQDALGRRHVIGQRGQRVLHHGDLDAFSLQQRNDFGPVGAIGEGAVYDDHRRLRGGGMACCGKQRSGHGESEGERLGFEHGQISCFW
ncbi:hypothetical protein D3C87_1091820 [compost metagenome]